jgi:hypothetical protein
VNPSLTAAPALTVRQAASRILARQVRELLGYEKAARSGEDAEAVHQMRVQTRRLRAALTLLWVVSEERLEAQGSEGAPARPMDLICEDLKRQVLTRFVRVVLVDVGFLRHAQRRHYGGLEPTIDLDGDRQAGRRRRTWRLARAFRSQRIDRRSGGYG